MSNLHSPYVFVQTGISLSTVGQTQELKLLGQLGSTYVANPNLNIQPFMYFGVGNAYQLNPQLRWNSNFAYMFIGNGTTSGNVWQLNNPVFNKVNYHFTLNSNILLFDNMLTFSKHAWQPGLILGIGITKNTAEDYSETTTSATSQPMQKPFANHSEFHRVYELGLALSHPYSQGMLVFSYRYIDAGSASLGLISLQNTQDRLHFGKVAYSVISVGWEFNFAL